MAVVSSRPLALKWVVDNSHKRDALFSIPIKSVCHPEISTKAFPTIKLRRRHSCHVLNPINMTLGTTKGVTRRTANYHPNLWDDDFIQSLPKPYEDPSYAERAERLIRDIKEIFNAMSTGHDVNSSSHYKKINLFDRISMVDLVQRLGIDRHFRTEIQLILDYVYGCLNEKALDLRIDSPDDLNTTALAFRILRLRGYDVSSDLLGRFKQENGDFLCSKSYADREIKTILSLYRASLIAFPGEKVMDEAKAFATKYLEESLQNLRVDCNISREIVFNLEYSWPTIVPRLEARTYIDLYQDNQNFKTPLELAKLDFNMMQSLQQAELQIVSRWWAKSGLSKLEFARHRHVEYYFWPAGVCAEPEYSFFRIGFAKIASLATYIDDMFDIYGTLDELKLFADAVKRWDPFEIDDLPEYMKIAFKGFYNTVNDIAREAEKNQGRYTLDYTRKAWEVFIKSQMKESEWIYSGYMPTLQEYVENGKVSSGSSVFTMAIVLTLDAPIPLDFIPEMDYPSRFDELLYTILRLRGDTKTYKDEAASGEKVSCITCYMRDHPGSTEDDALNYLNDVIDELIKELNWEYLKPESTRSVSKDYSHAMTRGLLVFYRERDGYSIADKDLKSHVLKTILEAVPM